MVEQDCNHCENYIVREDRTNKDHEEELRECIGELPGVEDLFDQDGHIKNPDEPYMYVDCIKGHLDDEADFFSNKALDCQDFKFKKLDKEMT